MKTDQPLLTVIVPCYNLEKYVDKCISSITAQTYPNLEILLVDDGSTDKTGALLDAWQAKDRRIKVIHKQNQGSSYARKIGVENATGEYITFVDADDWIDENMYLNMMSALLSTHSDIAQCGVCDAYEDGRIEHRISGHKDGSFEIVDRIKGVLLIIESKKWQSYLCNKIFKKNLFSNIEFPVKRKRSEDTAVAHILFHHASQSVYLKDEYYFYLQRAGSKSYPQDLTSKIRNSYHSYLSFYERFLFVEQQPEYHSCLIIAKNNAFFRGMRALRNCIIYPQYFPEGYYNSLLKQLNMIHFNRKDILQEFITPLMSIEISTFLISPALHKMIIMLYANIISFLQVGASANKTTSLLR